MTSGNLGYTEISAGQNQKEVTANADFAIFDKAITEQMSSSLSSGNATITTAQFQQNIMFKTTGNSVSHSLTFPAVKRSLFVIYNGGSAALSVVVGSTTLTLAATTYGLYSTDGTANGIVQITIPASGVAFIGLSDAPASYSGAGRKRVRVNAAANALEFVDASYTPACFVPGAPTNSQLVFKFVAVVPFTLPASLTGSYSKAGTAATGAVSFAVLKNGSSQGTIDYAISGTTATFTFASDVAFSAGDVLSITAPATADATLADIAISIKAYLT